MNKRTISAINAIAAAQSDDFNVEIDDNCVKVTTYYTIDFDDEYVSKGRYADGTVEAHRLENGRWIRAHWSTQHCQWQSADFSGRFSQHNRNAVYCFARQLEALAGDIKTYPSATAAVRAAFSQ